MIDRLFYRFSEAADRLGTDGETLRQAVALGKLPVFLEFNKAKALWVCGDEKEERKTDPYCRWHVDLFKLKSRDIKSHVDNVPEDQVDKYPPSTLDGSFRVSESCAIRAARTGFFGPELWVGPSSIDPEFAPWNLWFVVQDDTRPFEACAWFLTSEVDSANGASALVATK